MICQIICDRHREPYCLPFVVVEEVALQAHEAVCGDRGGIGACAADNVECFLRGVFVCVDALGADCVDVCGECLPFGAAGEGDGLEGGGGVGVEGAVEECRTVGAELGFGLGERHGRSLWTGLS